MKRIVNMMLLALMVSCISSCKNDLDSLEGGNHRIQRTKEKPKFKTLCLSFGGDFADFINEEEEPLLRAETGDTLVGINVLYSNKEDGIENQPYAYGLFPRTDKIYINLLTGNTYNFEASILIEKEDKMVDNSSSTKGYGQPFRTTNGDGFFPLDEMDKFKYAYESTNSFKFKELQSGTALVYIDNNQFGEMRFPRVKRFKGEVSAFDPLLLTDVNIPMNYKCFGLKIEVEDIPDHTQISFKDVTDSETNPNNKNKNPNTDYQYFLQFPKDKWLNKSSEESKSWEGLYSLNDLTKDTQDFKLRFFWYKGPGLTIEQFDYPVTVEAKKKKILKINVSGDVNETKTGNIIIAPLIDTLVEDEEKVNHDFNQKP